MVCSFLAAPLPSPILDMRMPAMLSSRWQKRFSIVFLHFQPNSKLQANLAGDFFPIWGTCLGFEMMVLMANEGKPYRAALVFQCI